MISGIRFDKREAVGRPYDSRTPRERKPGGSDAGDTYLQHQSATNTECRNRSGASRDGDYEVY